MKTENKPEKLIIPLWKKRWFVNCLFVIVGILGVYVLIYLDVVSRSKEAYQEGEKYMSWFHEPSLKEKYFQARFEDEKEKLDKKLAKKTMTEEEYREQLEVLKFDQEFNMAESPLKYAYQWYKDAFELFSPPESKWVKLAREKAPQVLEMWKQELREKKIPFEDYMFE